MSYVDSYVEVCYCDGLVKKNVIFESEQLTTCDICSGVDYSGSDPIGPLAVGGYCASLRHRCCTKDPLELANLTIRGLMVRIDHTEE